MASWRKNQEINNSEVGHCRYSSYNGKPPLDNRFSTVPWRRVLASHSNVMKWEDSGVKQAVYAAKFRFWAEINGFRCDIPLPDPDMYIDDVDWDASVDPQLSLDLDREIEARCKMIENSEQETMILGIEGIEPTGWGDDDDEEVTKPQEPSYGADGWESNKDEPNSWEENDSQRWIPKEHYVADFPNMYQARNDGYERRKNNMSRSANHAYQHGNNEFKINRGRRNGGRGRWRGNYKVATPHLW